MVTYEIFHLAIYLLVQLFPLADAAGHNMLLELVPCMYV
jgi:hypothetical protein